MRFSASLEATPAWCAVLVALLTSCANAVPSASVSEPPASGPRLTDARPGRPFDAAAVLDAMRDSRRPGGVPDELETEATAEAIAGRIWTLDGEAWATTTAGGSCGPRTCTLEIAGADPGTQGDDLWVFEVEPATATVEVVSTDLRALPLELVDQLDELTRSILPGSLQGLNLTNARWLPGPNETRFVMSYRDGDDEGSACGADVSVDMMARRVLSEESLDC